ncbi:four helix bundle protein [Fervidibacter sacchari]
MAIAKRFEDLGVWQEARELVRQVYELTATPPFRRDTVLIDQMRKAALSIMANIAEGFGRKTNRDFARFLAQARGSASELQSHLYVALDQRYIGEDRFSALYEKCDHISRMLHRLITYLHANSTRNPQLATRNSQPSTPHSALSTKRGEGK